MPRDARAECNVTVYGMDGALVQTIRVADGSDAALWDGLTAGGEEAPSGEYLYMVRAHDGAMIASGTVSKN